MFSLKFTQKVMSSGHPENESATLPPNTSPSTETTTPEQDLAPTITQPSAIVQYIAVPITFVPNIAVPINIKSNIDVPITAVTTPATTTPVVTTTAVNIPAMTIPTVDTTSVTTTFENTIPMTTAPVTIASMVTDPVTATTKPYIINIPFAINNSPLNLQLTIQIFDKAVQPTLTKNEPENNLQKSPESTNSVNDNSGNNNISRRELKRQDQSSSSSFSDTVDDNQGHSSKKRKTYYRMLSARQYSSEYRGRRTRSSNGRSPVNHSCKTSRSEVFDMGRSVQGRSSSLHDRGTSSDAGLESSCQKSLLTLTAANEVQISNTNLSCPDSNSIFIEPSKNVSTSVANAETSHPISTFTREETPVTRAPITYPVAPNLRKNNKHLLALLNSDSSSNNGSNGAIVKKQ